MIIPINVIVVHVRAGHRAAQQQGAEATRAAQQGKQMQNKTLYLILAYYKIIIVL